MYNGPRWEYEWDPGKAASNIEKHGIAFPDAVTALLDPLATTIPGDDAGA